MSIQGEAEDSSRPLTFREDDEKKPRIVEQPRLTSDQDAIKLSKRRWIILAIFMFYGAANVGQWVQYSIIANIVSRYYGVSMLAVDWTSMTFMAYYLLLVFPGVYVISRAGLKWTAIMGSFASCIAAWIKVFSVAPDRFWLTFVGQSVVAMSQVAILSVPGHLAANWFGPREVSTASSLAMIGTQIGVGLSFLVTPMIVRNHADLDLIGQDLTVLFKGQAIVTTVAALVVVLFFKDEPALPPSRARALQKSGQDENKESFASPMKRLFTNKCFLILCNSYGVIIGVFNAVSTLLNQMILIHFENGEEDAGRIGLVIIFAGIVGATIYGLIIDRTRKFKEVAVIVYFLTFSGEILFAVSLWLESKLMVYITAGLLGFCMNGYLVIGYELCAEYTYPEPENMATGLLNIVNNAYGMLLILVVGKLIETYGEVSAHITLTVILLVGLVMTVSTKDEQRRQKANEKPWAELFGAR